MFESGLKKVLSRQTLRYHYFYFFIPHLFLVAFGKKNLAAPYHFVEGRLVFDERLPFFDPLFVFMQPFSNLFNLF